MSLFIMMAHAFQPSTFLHDSDFILIFKKCKRKRKDLKKLDFV